MAKILAQKERELGLKVSLPDWVEKKQPQNKDYWRAVFGWAAVVHELVQRGEMLPDYTIVAPD